MAGSERVYWENKLKENEKLLWSGAPTETGLFDPARKAVALGEFIFAAVWVCVTLAMFASKTNGVMAVIIMELPALLVVMLPFMDARSVSNSRYAITDKRVIIRNGNDDYSMEYGPDTPVEKRSNNTVCVGAAIRIKPSQERHVLLFHGIQNNDKECIGVVLYTTTDPDGAVKALHS